MKKFFLCILLCSIGVWGAYSQDTLRFANSGFEDWITESGYTVHTSPIDANLKFFNDYVRPAEWNRAYYHMNKTITKNVIITITATIDTDVPVHNFSKYTKKVTEGSTAACLSSFQLNDVISSTAIQYGSSNLANYGLTEDMVCASIISTGNLTKNGSGTYIKQIVNFGLLGCGGEKNEAELYEEIKNYDMNKYVEGGLALEGFYPTRLHGSYMYKSSSATDAGEVILIGTHYDSQAKKRLIVGGGYKNDLNVATSDFADFDVMYRPFVDVEPDSLVIICMSSGLTNCADESKLYLDNLYLLSDCFAVENLAVNEITTNSAVVTWDENRHISWEYVFGKKGFNIDEVEPVSCDDAVVELSDLEKNTEYEMYVRTICSATNISDWAKVEFTTLDWPTCENVTELAVSEISQLGAVVSWTSTEEGNTFEIYYGEEEVSIDDAEILKVETSPFTLGNLSIVTNYDVYVRAVRENAYASEWTKASFTTLDWPTCEKVTELVVSEITQSGAIVSWSESEYNYEIAFGESGFSLDDAEIESVTESGYVLSNLKLHTSYDMYVRAVKENAYASDWAKVEFTTLDWPTCENVTELAVSEISQLGAVVSWTSTEEGNTFEIYYGEEGVSIDDAEILKVETSPFTLGNLSIVTKYDVYVRAVRENAYASEWTKASFTTLDWPTCENVTEIVVSEITQSGAIVSWGESENNYEIAFGESGFSLDDAEIESVTENGYVLSNLKLHTSYDMYVRAVKENAYASEWTKISFTTLDWPTCENVTELAVSEISQLGAVVSWTSTEEGNTFEIYYGEEGVSIDDAEILKVEKSPFTLGNLSIVTNYDVYVRAVRENAYASEWKKASFTTLDWPTCENVTEIVVSEITQSGAIVSWGESENNYEIAFGESGFSLDDAEIESVTESGYVLSNLKLHTSYDMYVRAVKENAYASEWTKIEFTTLDMPTCESVSEVSISDVTTNGAVVSWTSTEEGNAFEIYFGEEGVSIDDAEFLQIETSPYVLANLSANTSYDVYVRAVREGAYNGEWQKVSFVTEKITCAPVSNVEITAITDTSAIIFVPLSEYTYQLVFAPFDEAYDLSQPIVLSDVSYQLNNLSEETSYVVYVRAVKEGYADGEWTKYEFTTKKTEPVIVQLNPVEGLNVIHEDSTYYVIWNESQYEYEISYGLSGFDIDTAVSYHITGNNYQIPELENGTYDVYVRAVSDENTPSEWQKVSFEYEKKEVMIEPECKFESVVQDFFAGYLVSGDGLCGIVDLTWENPETNPQYEWFDVAIYEFAEGMDNTVDEEDIQRITNPYFNVSYTEYANVAKELVLYVRVGAEGCESSDWAKYQFTAPTIDVAIDEVENDNVSVYPTLSDGTFFISFNSQASADVIVYDVNGSIVTKMNDVANNTPIQLSQKGLYKVEVVLDGKKTVKSVVIY